MNETVPNEELRWRVASAALAVPGALLVAYSVFGILAEPETAAEVLPGLILRVVLLSLCVVVVVVEVAIRARWVVLVVPVGAVVGALFGALLWMLAGNRISLTDGSDGTVWTVAASAMLGLVIGIGAWVSSRCWSPAAERPRS